MQSEKETRGHDSESTERREKIIELAGWFTGFVIFTLIMPYILIIALPPEQRLNGIAVLGATPAIEYLAVTMGIGLGLDPVTSFLLTILPCIGLSLLVLGLLGFLSESSKRATRFLEKVHKKIEKYPRLKRYGVISNFVFVMFMGIYIAPSIAIILGWSRFRSAVYMAGGICLITLLIGLGTLGVMDMLFG